MERTFVVLFALASISPAAEPLDSKPVDSKPADLKTLCQAAHSLHDCAVLANNLGSTYFSAGQYRDAEPWFARAIELLVAETPLLSHKYQTGAVILASGLRDDYRQISAIP